MITLLACFRTREEKDFKMNKQNPLLFNAILVIHDLNEQVTKEDLEDHFSQFGKVKSVNMKQKPEKGAYYTFLKFEKTSEALRAVDQMKGQRMPGLSRFTVLLADFNKEYLEMDVEFQEMLHTLFVNHPKADTEDDLRDHFQQFGPILSVDLLKEKRTGKPRGLAFIKFQKQSDAGLAMEEVTEPYKAKWAHVRALPAEQINEVRLQKHREQFGVDGDAYQPAMGGGGMGAGVGLGGMGGEMEFNGSGMYEDDMMMGGGRLARSRIMESDGMGYRGMSAGGRGLLDRFDPFAAEADRPLLGAGGRFGRAALEEDMGDAMFRQGGGRGAGARMGAGGLGDGGFGSGLGERSMGGAGMGMGGFGAQSEGARTSIPSLMSQRQTQGASAATAMGSEENSTTETSTTLEVLIPQSITPDHLRKIFDICPGLLAFDTQPGSRMAKIVYKSAALAAHAKEKVDGLEWNSEIIAVRYPPEKTMKEKLQETLLQLKSGNAVANFGNIVSSLEEVISTAVASKKTQNQGPSDTWLDKGPHSGLGSGGEREMVPWSTVPLPAMKPLAEVSAEVKAEVFLRARPGSVLFPDEVLFKVLCRFGNLINAFWVKSLEKREAFARFATVESAQDCLDTLNGAVVYNVGLKCMWSKNSKYHGEKRPGTAEDGQNPKKMKLI